MCLLVIDRGRETERGEREGNIENYELKHCVELEVLRESDGITEVKNNVQDTRSYFILCCIS